MDTLFAVEIVKRAQMLVKTKGPDALEHSNMILESMLKKGDDEGCAYWHRIVKQVEVMVEEKGLG